MPIIKSAKKKMKQDKKRKTINKAIEKKYKDILKRVKKTTVKEKSKEWIAKAYKAIDKATKKGIFHKNKAARLKAQVGKFFSK